ncbi:MAG: 30S ribosomal protein S16 [bacterium]|nr:30S ribosomal protein S16 [bacterium]
MAATVRLYRIGKRHYPIYRIVVVHKREKRNGGYIEELGMYNPMTKPHTLNLDQKRFDYWKNTGAIISEGLGKILHTYSPAPVQK